MKLENIKSFLLKNIKFIIAIVAVIIVMFYFIGQKEGFHEDEIFSYGSSNYKYDNVFRYYGIEDETNVFVKTVLLQGNILHNLKYYLIDHNEEIDKYLKEHEKLRKPIWKTSEDANEYMSIGAEDIGNYWMVYYNQSRDVHPPLFYFLVHTVSIFFYGHFSKYIIFIINLAFMIGTLIVFKKICVKLDKKHLALPCMILFGFSMGAISMVMFQRMYSMLTFFVMAFISVNLDIVKNELNIDKKTWIKLGTICILGYLTHFYFCIIAFIIALGLFIWLCLQKEKSRIIKYIVNYIKIALIGILLFPLSIHHIFFSYRGIGVIPNENPYIEKLVHYFNIVGESLNISIIVLIIIPVISFVYFVIDKKINKETISANSKFLALLFITSISYIFIITELSPEFQIEECLRYIVCITPILIVLLLISIDSLIKNKLASEIILTIMVCLISILGLIVSEPTYLYKGYSRYTDIAKQNSSTRFLYVGDTVFNYMQSMPEFLIYDNSMIMNTRQLDSIFNNKELENEDEFIISIKKYLNPESIIEQIVEKTEFKKYELLLDDNGNVACKIYRMERVKNEVSN